MEKTGESRGRSWPPSSSQQIHLPLSEMQDSGVGPGQRLPRAGAVQTTSGTPLGSPGERGQGAAWEREALAVPPWAVHDVSPSEVDRADRLEARGDLQ